ncbi:potassium transporter TrkA [Planctomycetales bacterium ZRK34]|nr:potassium transporter TrkA [Planctomycetales bacterium ZRK34]
MVAIISLLTVLVLSLLVVRVATVALTLTGLSKQLARFQARSAFTGSGFTTTESEKVVHHPVRRRIIMLLMLLGNAGIVTAMSSLILSFVQTNESGEWTESLWFRMGLLVVGLTVLWIIAYSRWVDRHLSRLIQTALRRWTNLEIRDYAGLLHLAGDFAVTEMTVRAEDWVTNRDLASLRLSEEGVLVLGIERADGSYDGAPRGDSTVHADDTLLLYGPRPTLAELDQRGAGAEGNWAHIRAIDRKSQFDEHTHSADQSNATSPLSKST